MKVLYATANAHLRSTTSSLNAIIRGLQPMGITPVMLFGGEGPWQKTLAQHGITCYQLPFFTPDRRDPVRSLSYTLRLFALFKRERIALVHCNEHELYPALRIAAYWARIPVITTLHWYLEPGFGPWAFAPPYQPAGLQFLSRGQLRLSEPNLPPDFPRGRVHLLMSGLLIDEFLGRGGDGTALRASWVDDDRMVVLGSASAIKPRKHLEDFIMIVSRLRATGRPVLGVIAGGGGAFEARDYRDSLVALIKREGLERHCLMVGNLDPVTPFFRAIDINVNCAEMEILSMSMCEAMACGRPTIAYAVGGNPETVHNPWCVVPFGDLDALTQRAMQLVDDTTLRHEMGAAAERHVRTNFDGPVLTRRQAEIYRAVLGPRLPRVWPQGGATSS